MVAGMATKHNPRPLPELRVAPMSCKGGMGSPLVESCGAAGTSTRARGCAGHLEREAVAEGAAQCLDPWDLDEPVWSLHSSTKR
jgi:hypothetical protein